MVINLPWICSIMKIYVYENINLWKFICGVLVQIWEKCCSWGIGQNPVSHSDRRIFKSSISPASFLACWYKFTKIKSYLKSFWWGMVKNECVRSGHWTLKLTVSEEITDGTDFLHAGIISRKLKGDWKFLGWA